MVPSFANHELRENTNDFATSLESSILNAIHKTEVAGTCDNTHATFCQQVSYLFGGFEK